MRVSVVIPCYNAAKYLRTAIESVRAQTRPVDEIIVVDDRSSDDSLAVARALGVTCLATPKNAGPAAARNLGICHASGELVAFLDGDDFWEPDHCATVVPLLERHPAVLVAHGSVRRHGGTGETVTSGLADGVPLDVLWTLVHHNIVPQSGAVARRDAILAVGGYDESMRYSEDYDLWLRLARRGPFACSHAVTTNYRVHPDQSTRSAIPLVAGWWTARTHLRSTFAAEQRTDELARLESLLADVWEEDLAWAWRQGDRAVFDVVLAQRELVPGSAAIRARWERRAQRYWSLWVPTVALWDRLPQSMKNVLKTPVRALRGTA